MPVAYINRHLQKVNPARFRKVLAVGAAFFLGQGGIQAVNILAGLFLVRALSVEHYAQFGLASGFQATASLLMDLGYASTIIPLVGERVNDRKLVGSYLRAAKHFRDKSFSTLGPFVAITFLALIHRHHWSLSTQICLLGSVLLGLYSSGPLAYYSAPLLLNGKLREFYLPQFVAGVVRLLFYVALKIAHALNAAFAAALLSLNTLVSAVVLRKRAHRYIEWPQSNEPAINKEVRNFIFPAMPTFIFAAFQSQIALFLINAFGQTVNVAEVAALSRIAQLFVVLNGFNLIVVEPAVARLENARLLRAYILLVLPAACLSLVVVPLAFTHPNLFLSLIGPQYSNLAPLIGWVVVTACLNYAANLIWIMNRSRKWIFWRGTFLEIGTMLSIDLLFAAYIGVHNTRQAVLFTLAASCSALCTHTYIGVHGFRQAKLFPGRN